MLVCVSAERNSPSTRNICGAGVVGALLQVQAHPRPLCVLIMRLISSEAARLSPPVAQQAADGEGQGKEGSEKSQTRKRKAESKEDAHERGGLLEAPAQPLASLWTFAQQMLTTASPPAAVEMPAAIQNASEQMLEGQADQQQGARKKQKKGQHENAASTSGKTKRSPQQIALACGACPSVRGCGEILSEIELPISAEEKPAKDLDVLGLQTGCFCAPVKPYQLPTLAILCWHAEAMQMLVRVCQAHCLDIFGDPNFAQVAATPVDGKHGPIAALLGASSATMMLQSAATHPGRGQ